MKDRRDYSGGAGPRKGTSYKRNAPSVMPAPGLGS